MSTDTDAMDTKEALEMLGIDGDDLVINDDDPFAELDPKWAQFARHLMEHFHPEDLPPMIRPFAPAATAIVAAKLAADPDGSYAMALELIGMCVRDLDIDRSELAQLWGEDGHPTVSES